MNTRLKFNTNVTPEQIEKFREWEEKQEARRDAEKAAAKAQAKKDRESPMFGEVPDLTKIPATASLARTDMGLAERFRAHYGHAVRFAPGKTGGEWYIYNGKRWEIDYATVKTSQFMRNVIRSISTHEAQHTGADSAEVKDAEDALQEAISKDKTDFVISTCRKMLERAQRNAGADHEKFGRKCEDGTGHVDAALKALRSSLHVDSATFDLNLELINAQNGTVNIRTGQLQPHNPEDLITKIATVDYEAGATHPDLDRVMATLERNSKGLSKALSAFLGSATTGLNTARALWYLKGMSNAGKSTLIEAACMALGIDGTGYASIVSPLVFALSPAKGNEANDHHHNMRGVRLVFADEAEAGFLDRAMINTMVAGGQQNTRPLFGQPVQWKSQTKIILAGNDWMKMPDNDPGLTSRLVAAEMPFELTAEEKDEDLQYRLQSPEGRRAILAMMVREGTEWIAKGATREALHVTEAMKLSALECLGGSDPLADFWAAEVLEVGDAKDYYALNIGEWMKAYARFCREHGISQSLKTPSQLKARLEKRGYEAVTNTTRTMKFEGNTNKLSGWRYYGIRHTLTNFAGVVDKFTAEAEIERMTEPAHADNVTVIYGLKAVPTPAEAPAPAPVEAPAAPAPAEVEAEEDCYGYTADQIAQLSDFEEAFAA